MNVRVLDALRGALIKRGFDAQLMAPNGTMGLDESFLAGVEIADLLERLVARREKVFRSVEVTGEDASREAYHDVVAAIDATKEVIGTLVLP